MARQHDLVFKGMVFALAATILWSGNFLVGRALAGQVPPFTLAFLRWGSASIVILPLCWKAFTAELPKMLKDLPALTFASLTVASAYSAMLYFAARTTPVLNMTLLAATAPIFTLILARIFLKERLIPLKIVGIVIALLGVVLLAVRGDLGLLMTLTLQYGDVLTLIATLLFAIYTVFVRYRQFGLNPVVLTAALAVIAAIMLLPFAAWEVVTGQVRLEIDSTARTITIIAAIVYVGAGASVGSTLCWNRAIEAIGASNAMLFYYTIPFFSGVEAVLLLGEPVVWIHWVSGAFILCGILIATRFANDHPGKKRSVRKVDAGA